MPIFILIRDTLFQHIGKTDCMKPVFKPRLEQESTNYQCFPLKHPMAEIRVHLFRKHEVKRATFIATVCTAHQ